MAGNIVKWWRHKILGGYKHFSGLHECPTDTEELIYPIRAPSSCSAPPDLLLTSDKEQIHIRCPSPQSIKETEEKIILANKSDKTIFTKDNQERLHLEEFTCDVAVEGGGKTPQPLQFSFTLYDLEGHGKITKDDIAGIVSTIYESIGKTVVVPHYGSKTINVRLTVSPDGKKIRAHKKAMITPRRRVRPRKLISDDDGTDSSNDCNERGNLHTNHDLARVGGLLKDQNHYKGYNLGEKFNPIAKDCSTTTTTTDSATEHFINKITTKKDITHTDQQTTKTPTKKFSIAPQNENQNIYESIPKFYSNSKNACHQINDTLINNLQIKETNEACHDCKLEVAAHKHNLRKKILRKSRSRKQQPLPLQQNRDDKLDEPISRVRSLSVGNENCYNQVDGNEDCWKSSLRRNELIEIIRESMEKNRLCFQANRKPENSPINNRHRHRSHTISKMINDHNINLTDPNVNINSAPVILPETNLCGYDSFLHATICSNVNNNLQNLKKNQQNLSSNIRIGQLHHHNSKKSPKNFTKIQNHPPNFYNRLNQHQTGTPFKLNTNILNQLNPNLSAEQKLSRTINHVEKWLIDHEPQSSSSPQQTSNNKLLSNMEILDNKMNGQTRHNKLQRSKSKEEIPFIEKHNKLENLINFEKLKITEESSVNKKPSSKHQHHHHSNNSQVTLTPKSSPENISKLNKSPQPPTQQGFILEYASIPVNADPSECENLLRGSDEDTNNATSVTPSTVHRYVHEHIHHHYHHFENDEQ